MMVKLSPSNAFTFPSHSGRALMVLLAFNGGIQAGGGVLKKSHVRWRSEDGRVLRACEPTKRHPPRTRGANAFRAKEHEAFESMQRGRNIGGIQQRMHGVRSEPHQRTHFEQTKKAEVLIRNFSLVC